MNQVVPGKFSSVLSVFTLIFYNSLDVLGQVTTDPLECRENQWRCKDDSCIPAYARCDGKVDCTDGSDETFPLCRNNKCSQESFRCAYGACVNGTAACNKVQECADNSDELMFRCQETDHTRCSMTTLKNGVVSFVCRSTERECDNGWWLTDEDTCDGKVDCADGTDETIIKCTEKKCPDKAFRCAYGGCTHEFAQCNGIADCADSSDESDELCDRVLPVTTPKNFESETTTTPKPATNVPCILPPIPDHGTYIVAGNDAASPGEALKSVYLNVTCEPPYKILGKNLLYCFNGMWSDEMPTCVLYCKLKKHPSVEYRCIYKRSTFIEASRVCNDEEPSGATVRPRCNTPNYYYPGVLSFMHCADGSWDSVAICSPECGRITPEGKQLVIGGQLAKRGELPWHVGIYSKTSTPFQQICGGSILSTKVTISAAHCFWGRDDRLLPAANYALAVGKLGREWDDPEDTDVQKSDVAEIKVPARYRGVAANFQDDIALLIVTTAFEYRTYVRPVCMDFDYTFNNRQLADGNLGKVAGWGFRTEDGEPSPLLNVVNLPFINVQQCLEETPVNFREYITSDKICAGYKNGTAVCKGDSGGGFTFPETERGVIRHYLRGVVSTSPKSDSLQKCNAYTYTTFTNIIYHQYFIKEYYGKFKLE